VTGSLDSGEDPIAILDATVSGDQVVWVLDMNGAPGRISGRLTNGWLEGEWAMNAMSGSLVLTRTGEAPPLRPRRCSAGLMWTWLDDAR